MRIIKTKFLDLFILETDIFSDNRGFFMESWNKKKMEEVGLFYEFVQDNYSFSSQKGTLRGIHFQNGDKAQTKLVRCIRGSILDVAVDLRHDSPTYKEWISIELSSTNKKQILIPRGFGHGFITLTDDVEIFYKVDNFYSPEADNGIRWDDREIGVDWRIKNPILSEKDRNNHFLKELEIIF